MVCLTLGGIEKSPTFCLIVYAWDIGHKSSKRLILTVFVDDIAFI